MFKVGGLIPPEFSAVHVHKQFLIRKGRRRMTMIVSFHKKSDVDDVDDDDLVVVDAGLVVVDGEVGDGLLVWSGW
ncbi:hypothetical protein LWI29_033912 [Acer saccharum]|uniref:Uncharacterized protein n=1 Tax=Acer saccharum TaxID=4024 RepID=A0AA39SIR2_ACESA|nr:hypothetical protein LWI29_033912 [Acer saccharum]